MTDPEVVDTESSIQERLAALRARLHDATSILSADQMPEDSLLREGRLERLDQALGSIGLNYGAIENASSQEAEQANDDDLLPVEQMHRAYGDHPWVRQRRPQIRPVNLSLADSAEIFIDCTRDWPVLGDQEAEYRLKTIIDNGLAAFEIMTDPAAQPELLQAVLEGTDAYLRFLEGNVRLPLKVVHSYRRYQNPNDENLDFSSLYFVGLNSLTKAIQKFDPSKGFAFSTYAMFWIRQAIGREVRATRRLVRLPEEVDQKVRDIRAFSEFFTREYGRQPTDEELYQNGYTLEDLLNERTSRSAVSLDRPVNDESDATLGDLIGSVDSEYDEVTEEGGIEAKISKLFELAELSEQQLVILSIRYGLELPDYPEVNRRVQQFRSSLLKHGFISYNTEKISYRKLAEFFSLSPEAVRRAEKRAFNKLRSTHAHLTEAETAI